MTKEKTLEDDDIYFDIYKFIKKVNNNYNSLAKVLRNSEPSLIKHTFAG